MLKNCPNSLNNGCSRFTDQSIHSLDTGICSWETSDCSIIRQQQHQQSSDEIESIDTIISDDYYNLQYSNETQKIIKSG